MALVGNISLLHKSPAKYTTGTVGFNDRANWNKPGMMRSRGNLTLSTMWKYDAIPGGMYAGRAFLPPQKVGAMKAREAFGIEPTAAGVGGITTTASASFVIDFASAQPFPLNDASPLRTAGASFSIFTNTPAGQLISSGNGAASFSITINSPLLTASLNAIGSTSFAITFNAPLLGAIASGVGAAGVLFSTSATILPINDASPLRTGTANFALTGNLIPYAIGSMSGGTVDAGILTNDSISSAVWSAIAAQYTVAGSMGQKLNSAASGGVDYTALGQAVWSAATRTLTTDQPTKEEVAAAVWAHVQ